MRKKASELIFISVINRDGSGTKPISESFLEGVKNNPLMRDQEYYVHRLSITLDTYIAISMNGYVVKLKENEGKEETV